MIRRPTQPIQRCLCSRCAIMLAAAPISTTDSSRPMIRMFGVVLGGAGHRQDVVERHRDVSHHDLPDRGAERLVCAASAGPASSASSGATSSVPCERSSRNIFQQTHSSGRRRPGSGR